MQRIHLIGIGGAGLSAIATVLLQQGYAVSGSDGQDSESSRRLRALGAHVEIGHDPAHLGDPDVVVVSSAIAADNPEILEARRRQIPVLKRPAWLGHMMAGKRGLAIAGTHGKTTTTAMVSLILSRAGLSPTYIIGGFSPQLASNAAAGQSDLFVIEADEYDHTFLSLTPEIAVVTTVEWDHPDIYQTEAAYRQAFVDFLKLVPPQGKIILGGDDPGVQQLLPSFPAAISYGLAEDNLWRALNPRPNTEGGYRFELEVRGKASAALSLQVPGLHNVRNSLAALAMADAVGVPIAAAAATLSTYSGTGRRFELKGSVAGITVIDDYAHHPTEVLVNLAAARVRFGPKSIWAVFQPHTFSRTKLLLDEFAAAFSDANHVILLDIYPSREQDDGTVHSSDILKRMRHPDARHIAAMADAAAYLQARLAPGDVLITFGAGDGYKVGEMVLQALASRQRGPAKVI